MIELKLNAVRNFAKNRLTVTPASGWAAPEETFVWNDGDMSTIWFKANVSSDLLKIALVVAPNIGRDVSSQRVQVFLNGILVGYKRFTDPGFQGFEFTFPTNLLQDLNKLDFVFLDSEQPAKTGGADQRRLAAAFESIQLQAA